MKENEMKIKEKEKNKCSKLIIKGNHESVGFMQTCKLQDHYRSYYSRSFGCITRSKGYYLTLLGTPCNFDNIFLMNIFGQAV